MSEVTSQPDPNECWKIRAPGSKQEALVALNVLGLQVPLIPLTTAAEEVKARWEAWQRLASKAYKAKMLGVHPDRHPDNPDAERAAKYVNLAAEVVQRFQLYRPQPVQSGFILHTSSGSMTSSTATVDTFTWGTVININIRG